MKFNKVIIINLVAIIFCSLIFSYSASAAPSFANAAQGIEISPALVELNAEKGKTYNINLSVRNVTAADLTYVSSVADFEAGDETGSPKITINSSLPVSASIRSWTSVLSEFSLKSRQSKTIIAQIIVPSNAEPGGHYGVIRFTNRAPGLSDTGVGLAGSAGVLVLIRVSGEITEKASLSEFYSAISNKQSSFFENSPITFITRIKNDGNTHVKPTGSIQIYDMFGRLIASLPVNEDKSNLLPNSIRRFESTYSGDWMIGRYTANLALGYGATGQAITATIQFWVIPYKLITIGIFVAITLIYILVRLIKVYNKYIIAKSKNEKTIKNKNSSKKKD
jgi:hypothetical protein